MDELRLLSVWSFTRSPWVLLFPTVFLSSSLNGETLVDHHRHTWFFPKNVPMKLEAYTCSITVSLHRKDVSQTCISNQSMSVSTNWGPKSHTVLRLEWKSSSVLNTALISNPNTSGMKCSTDCTPDLLTQPQLPSSLMLFLLNEHKSPTATLQNLVGNLPRGVELFIAAKGGLNLECDVPKNVDMIDDLMSTNFLPWNK